MTSLQYWLGIGANIGDPRGQMAKAIALLANHPSVSLEAVAALYRTPPWGKTDQPFFLNSALSVRSDLQPRDLLEAMKEIERQMDRRPGERWGPRPIDLDIIAWEGGAFVDERLTIPHVQAHERPFVLIPLADIAPELVLAGSAVADLADLSDRSGISQALPAGWHQDADNSGGIQL
ncbi:MAG: 2-amino-4-hydroxy-6-hydroxymethyldihydropteridine diphosphokinase [Pseudomonadota bacterium]